MFSSYKQTTVSKWRRSFAIKIAEKFQRGENPFQLQKQKSFKMADMFANSHVSKWRTCLPILMFQNGGHVCQFPCFQMADMFFITKTNHKFKIADKHVCQLHN